MGRCRSTAALRRAATNRTCPALSPFAPAPPADPAAGDPAFADANAFDPNALDLAQLDAALLAPPAGGPRRLIGPPR